MMGFLSIVLITSACLLTFVVGYLLGLTGVYFLVPDKRVPRVPPQKRFAVFIPAHNEEAIIETSMQSWHQVDYPKEMVGIHVIADNCTDRTIEIARSLGASVWDRQDYENRGKGQALAWALDTIDLKLIDAIVIVDADTIVDPEFLNIMNDRLVAGCQVVQGYDGVMNPYENSMTCLMEITNVMKNLLFNYAKSKVGLSVQLMGTGMCLDKAVMKQVGWKAFSIGEDGEQFAYMVRAGIHVEFEPRAKVFAQEASSFGQAYTQRVRWSAGRMQLSGLGFHLLGEGIRQRRISLVDAAITFLLPNYAMLANIVIAALLIVGLSSALPGRTLLAWWYGALFLLLVIYFVIGLLMSRPSKRLLGSLAFAPFFLLWKICIDVISLFHLREREWVRTRRMTKSSSNENIDAVISAQLFWIHSRICCIAIRGLSWRTSSMNALVERIYNASPIVVQNVLLSVYGGYLRAVRYGGVHQATLQELLRTQYETPPELKAQQQKRFIRLICHAYTTVPFYQEAFMKRSLTPDDIRSPEDLVKLPIVTKADLRADPERFLSSSFSMKALESIRTSGTTGTPLHLWFTRKSIQQNYAFFARALSWAGVAPGQRSATFAGRMFIPESQGKGPYWRYNFISHNVLLSSYHLSPKTIPLYLKQLEQYAPTFIDSYPSALYSIAQYVRETGQPCTVRPTAIITSSETLLDYQREAIEETFGCRIFDQYGSAEMVVFASQCERGSLHVHPEYGHVELLDQDGRAAEPGEPGEVVGTGFLNEAMPLIRYQIGDSAVLGTEPCLCGRHFPVFKTVLGRLDDTIVTVDGRRIGRLDPIFKGARGIKETQIIQVSPERVVVKMVKGEQFVPASAQAVVQELQRRIGDEMQIDLEFVDCIERSSSGKFRTVVSCVSQGRPTQRDPVQDSIKK